MMLSFRSSGIAIVIYFLVLIITLVTTRIDDKISLYQHNSTIFSQLNQQVKKMINKVVLLWLYELPQNAHFGY